MAWSRYSAIRNQFNPASRRTFRETNLAWRRSGIKHSCSYSKSPKSEKLVIVHLPPSLAHFSVESEVTRSPTSSESTISAAAYQMFSTTTSIYWRERERSQIMWKRRKFRGTALRSSTPRFTRLSGSLFLEEFKFSYKQAFLLFSFVDDLEGFAVYKKPHDEMKTRTGDSWSFDFRTNEEYGALL